MKSKLSLILSGIIFIALLFLDNYFRMMPMFEEDIPTWSGGYVVRTFLIIIASALFVHGVKGGFFTRPVPLNSWEFGLLMTLVSISVLFFGIIIYDPLLFYQNSIEDGPVELASAAFWLCSSGIFFYLCVRLFRKFKNFNNPLLWISIGFCFVFFILGMEEVSWFQRSFEFETPQVLSKINLQDECNFHNIATDLFELISTIGSFVFLILFPLVYNGTGLRFLKRGLENFVPGRTTIWVAALACSLYGDMWMILFMQLSFFVSLFVLIYQWNILKKDKGAFWILVLALVVLVGQVVYLVFNERMIRSFDICEHQEMIFAMAFFVYAVEISGRFAKEEVSRKR